MIRALVLSLVVFATQLVAADPSLVKKCETFKEPLPWAYCSFKTVGSQNPDVLYHFHGKGLNENAWNDEKPGELPYYPQLIRDEWKRRGFEPPTVITISFPGYPIPAWLLVEKNTSPLSGLFEVMTKVILPTIEKRLPSCCGKRMAIGESMGGFNLSQMLLKAGKGFDRVAILCPAMATVSPFATKEEILAYIDRTKANPQLVAESLGLAGAFIPTTEDWNKTSPVILASTLSEASPEIYLSCGVRDEWGFYEGAKAFAEASAKTGASIEWRPLYGGHCAVDPISVARFLSR